MMLSKNHLLTDLIGQSIMIGIFLICSIVSLDASFLLYFVLLFFIGIWQFVNGCVGAALKNNPTRIKYVKYSLAYLASLFLYGFIASSFNSYRWAEAGFFIYVGIGGAAFAAWYFRMTWLEYQAYEEVPRSFWDLKF